MLASRSTGRDLSLAPLRLSNVGLHLHSWLQGCPCHRGEALRQLQREEGSCPNSGRLLPQLAAGELQAFAGEVCAAAYGDVLHVLLGLAAAEVTRVLDDLEAGRQHLVAHVVLKGAYHSDLPLLLACLCHPTDETARGGARRAIQLWDAMSPQEQAEAHPLSGRFLRDGEGSHRSAVLRFATGAAPLADLPELEVDLYRLSLAKVDEHDGERPHALMKRELALGPHSGASLLSLSLRLPLWEWMLADDPEALHTLVACVERSYNAHEACFQARR